MHLIDKIIRISGAKFHCNIHVLTTVHDIQDYASLIFWHTLYMIVDITILLLQVTVCRYYAYQPKI